MMTVNASNIDKDWAWVTDGGRRHLDECERGDGAPRGAGAQGRGTRAAAGRSDVTRVPYILRAICPDRREARYVPPIEAPPLHAYGRASGAGSSVGLGVLSAVRMTGSSEDVEFDRAS